MLLYQLIQENKLKNEIIQVLNENSSSKEKSSSFEFGTLYKKTVIINTLKLNWMKIINLP